MTGSKIGSKIKLAFGSMMAVVAAACSTVPAYAEDVLEEAAETTTYTFDLIPIIGVAIAAFVAYKLIKPTKSNNDNGNEIIVEPDGETMISIQGNSNCYINNLNINGHRIPDIEVKDKVLYLDGVKKRHLGNNCRIYNRGKGIFVDGKYVN